MSKDDILKILNTYKTEHAEQYGITKIGLFGSCARGANTAQSDIDVFVTMQKPNMCYFPASGPSSRNFSKLTSTWSNTAKE